MSNSICYNCQTLIPKHTHLQSQFDHFMYLYKKKKHFLVQTRKVIFMVVVKSTRLICEAVCELLYKENPKLCTPQE